jgi:hypothetical protein
MEHRVTARLLSSFLRNPVGSTGWVLHLATLFTRKGVRRMTPIKRSEAYEERLATLEEMGIEEKALMYDDATDKIAISNDETAIKDFYARAFQEWALGNVEGTAEEIFETVRILLEED